MDIGEKLKLEGKGLLSFVEGELEKLRLKDEAIAAREERAAERQFAKDTAERSMQHEKDMAVLHLEEDRARVEQGNVSSREMNVSRSSLPKTPMLPRFKESEGSIDAYLVRFERYASNEGWNRDCYALYLSALLEGTALEVYHRLSDQEANDYDALKEALLRKYSLTVEDFRKKFYFSKQSVSETASQFFSRLEHFFLQWIALSKIDLNFDSLKELILGEQFLHSCPRDLALFIRERTPTNVSEMMKLTTVYTDSRAAAGMRQDKIMATPPMSKLPDRTSNPGNGQKTFPPRVSREPMRCFLCNEIGYKAQQCRKGRPPPHSTPNPRPKDRGPVYASACLTLPVGPVNDIKDLAGDTEAGDFVLACCSVSQDINLPVVKGFLDGSPVSVLRDTGCTGLLVRRNLVNPESLTGDYRVMIKVDTSREVVPVARCSLVSPVFTGTFEVLCVPHMVYDVIVGNIPGAYLELKYIIPPPANLSIRDVSSDTPEPPTATCAVQTRSQTVNEKGIRPLAIAKVDQLNVSAADFKIAQSEDKSLCKYVEQARQPREDHDKRHEYLLVDGLLCRTFTRNDEVLNQLVVPEVYRRYVLGLAHDTIMSGHLGVKKTSDRIMKNFFWPGISGDVKRYCQSCDICQRTVNAGSAKKVPLQLMPLIDVPFAKVAIDLIGPLSPATDRKHRWVLTLVDCATRYPEAVALTSTTTEAVADALIGIFSRVGVPKVILSDNGPQFVSGLMKEVARLMAVEWTNSSPYHPQANGLVERFNGTLKKMLIRLSSERPRDWDRYLEPLLFAYREVPQESTSFSPFELLHGRTIRGPMAILKEIWSGPESNEEAVEAYRYVFDLRNRIEDTCRIARENLESAQGRYKRNFDKKTKVRSLEVGDKVLLMLPTDHNKLMMRWKGPFSITCKVGINDYRIQIGTKERLFHVNMMKKYLEREVTAATVPAGDAIPFGEPKHTDLLPRHETTALAAILDPEDDPSLEVGPLLGGGVETIHDVQLCDSLPSTHTVALLSMLREYSDIFTENPGSTSLVEHVIKMNTDKPIRVKPYPFPFAKVSTIEHEVDKMLRLGVIEPLMSPYSSPLLLVKKADGSNRPVVDFRRLNKATVFDAEPMPNPELIFSRLAKDTYFSKLDCSKGYWQIAMRSEDKEKTAFSSPAGLFQFRRMPFGLVNAGASYCRMMRELLLGLDNVDSYVDDIIIHTQTWDQHIVTLRAVFDRLRNAGITVKPSKCCIGFHSVDFVGHHVGDGKIQTQNDKIEKVKNAPIPLTVTQVRSFLGLTGYYRKFINNYASIAAPLTDLTKKGNPTKVIWNEKSNRAFEELKEALCNAPILRLPNFDLTFILRTDASDSGIGAVLLQCHENVYFPVAYASNKLSSAQQKYAVIERECLAIIWALEKFTVYLYGKEFVIQTDHQPLTFLKTAHLSNPRLLRWALKLQPYLFRIEAIPGRDNVGADYLSRLNTM